MIGPGGTFSISARREITHMRCRTLSFPRR